MSTFQTINIESKFIMANEADKKTNWKVWVFAVAVAMAGIGGCTVKVMSGGDIADALQEGTSAIKQGYDITKSGEIPTK